VQARVCLLLAIGVIGGASSASAGPISSCATIVGTSGFACNFYETTDTGLPSEISNVVSLPSTVEAGYIVLLESPSSLNTDPTQWSDVLQFIDGGGGNANTAQLFSSGCLCFPTFATVNAAPNFFQLETQVGQGNDFTDSTTIATTFNTFNIFSAAPDPAPDAAPEPASLALMASALSLLVALALARLKKA
jgi:hypothetical protein